MKLILASGSAARAELLKAAGIRFRRIPADVHEPPPVSGESLRAYLIRLATLKARAIAERHPNATVLAADTALCLPPVKPPSPGKLNIISKPGGAARAISMLKELAGHEHVIGTGICVIAPATVPVRRCMRVDCVTARVRLRDLTVAEIKSYVACTRPWHCAGAYALQGPGAAIIAAIRGDPTTVVGLPVEKTLRLLEITRP